MLEIKTNQDFEKEVINSEVPVLVDFYAQWCGPCKMMSPVLDQLSTVLDGKAKVIKIDVDQAPELASKYQVMSIPCLIGFKNGQEAFKNVGFKPLDVLKKAMEDLI